MAGVQVLTKKITPETKKAMKTPTRLVHAGREPCEQQGFINTPIYRGSTVLSPTVADLYARKARFIYGTRGTPTTEALETAWTEIAAAAGTVLTPSGLAAVTLAL
jgi:cysteine-S-conjugate beta-lyase